jgi:hypothetical protein
MVLVDLIKSNSSISISKVIDLIKGNSTLLDLVKGNNRMGTRMVLGVYLFLTKLVPRWFYLDGIKCFI